VNIPHPALTMPAIQAALVAVLAERNRCKVVLLLRVVRVARTFCPAYRARERLHSR
jgi:hypothetical protein